MPCDPRGSRVLRGDLARLDSLRQTAMGEEDNFPYYACPEFFLIEEGRGGGRAFSTDGSCIHLRAGGTAHVPAPDAPPGCPAPCSSESSPRQRLPQNTPNAALGLLHRVAGNTTFKMIHPTLRYFPFFVMDLVSSNCKGKSP